MDFYGVPEAYDSIPQQTVQQEELWCRVPIGQRCWWTKAKEYHYARRNIVGSICQLYCQSVVSLVIAINTIHSNMWLCCFTDHISFGTFRREQFVQWAENLADQQTPSWLGLPNNAEKVLLTSSGKCEFRDQLLTKTTCQYIMWIVTFVLISTVEGILYVQEVTWWASCCECSYWKTMMS